MSFPAFIARRVANHRVEGGRASFSRLIIRIAVWAVALCIATMIITMALLRGFKYEISSKIFGFVGHIHITDINVGGGLADGYPIDINQNFYPSLDTVRRVRHLAQTQFLGQAIGEPSSAYTSSGIRHIQTYAIKAGIIETKEVMEGIILKGVGADFDWDFMQQYLVRGDTIAWTPDKPSREILLSQRTAERLQVDTGQVFRINFVEQGEQLRRNFKVAGIYKTGLEEYDQRFALVDIRQIQRLLGWNENQVGGFEVFVEDVD
ncbi:MAG: ABC transporter permease, partial [Bacteroidota bacterium]